MIALGIVQLGLNRFAPLLPALRELGNGLDEVQHLIMEPVEVGTYRFGNRVRAVIQEFLAQGEFLFALLGFFANGFSQIAFGGFE